MDELSKQHISTFATVIAVLVFNLIMFLLLEIPLLAYAISPESTEAGVQRFSDWLTRNGGRIALIGASAIVIFLFIRGTITLLS
jgi:Sap-like sulfolipid-1-addressing protein